MDGLTHTMMPRRRRPGVALLVACCLIGAPGMPVMAAGPLVSDVVTVHAEAVPQTLSAYGQVEPIAVVQVRVVDPGTLNDLSVVPGSVVAAGQALARIGGPRMRTLLIAREQSLGSARAREDAASNTLQIVRRQFATQLATRQAIDVAQNELAAARAAVQTADAQLREARDLQIVRAPTAGTVILVQAADGEQTAAGQAILTLQPAGRLWIRAAYYGAEATLLRAGMIGHFQPSGEGEAIPVKVASIASGLAADAGLRVGLVPTGPTSPAWWVSGQSGTVTLEGPTSSMIAVPTSALVLDRGRWWVLVHTPKGNEPQQVVPGPVQGWKTWISSGLRPGQQVVVTDAFLEYHRGIARSYTPPD
ncbi:MAG: efflux RND transporter periplasmic adaptor subunit [Burkholderiales bacterium]|nr:efflux RND transporter periplasmic adaptor subunit [Burkholderiales bacterium]MDE2076725.1 efflux RND transporter periplasmic adaptor subunit [Burkholderiales bacterium]MDE2431317.1 efflux RND transporter periplasmic adaptor subunit [Burkholderiales bacterium]